MLPNQKSSALGFALLLTTLATTKPLESVFVSPTLAQAAPPTFPLPTSVPSGTTIQIEGSSSMAAINQALKQQFEQKFSGSTVALNYAGTAAGLQALRAGKVDLAAIGRPLTTAERQAGLVPVALERGKIAVIVSPENPFKGGLTVTQFVQIIRGEITDWAELGGPPGKIRLIDRPDLSDTRAALRNYSIFLQSPDAASGSKISTPEDSTQAVAQQLGKDGLSYAPANQVLNQPSLRIVPMHNTLPTDPRYPFSQPFFYVHTANPSPSAAAFLGYTTSEPGRQTAQTAAINPAALALDPTALLAAGTVATAALTSAGGNPAAPTATAPTMASSGAPSDATPAGQTIVGQAPPEAASENSSSDIPGWLGWLLPLGLAALLVGWLLHRRRSTPPTAEAPPVAPVPPPRVQTPPPPPPPLMTPLEPNASLASRAESIISSDRAAIAAEAQAPAVPPATALGSPTIAGSQFDRADPDEAPEIPTVPDPVAGSETPAIAETLEPENPTIAETPELETETPAIAETPSVPKRPLVEIRENPAIAIEPPAIEPPAAPPELDLDLPDRATLSGAAGLGAAAGITQTQSDTPPEPEPFTPSGSIEPWEQPEDAAIQGDFPVVEAQLEAIEPGGLTGASAIVTPAEPEVIEAETIPEGESEIAEEALVILDTSEAGEIAVDSGDAIGEAAEPDQTEGSPKVIEADIVATSEPHQSEASPEMIEASAGEFGSTLPTVAAVGGLAAGLTATRSNRGQTEVEAARFDVGQSDLSSETLASVDEGLPDLPDGYGESRIVLMPRDPQWAYAYWDIPHEHKSELRQQGGQHLVLRLYDVTDITLADQSPQSLQQFECDELARDWYLPIPVSDRDYVVEIGYLTGDGRWLMLARSLPVRIPPTYPSAWEHDQFITITWDEDLRGQTFVTLTPPSSESAIAPSQNDRYDQIFTLSQGAELQRIAGSMFGSMQQAPTSAVSSFVFPSGIGMWALPTVSGMSGMGMSGMGMFSGGAVPIRPRQFWLVADAELIIYGATEPDATVSIGGQTIPLNPDGTFRFQMSFQDGLINYPILAVAKDGEQTRSIHLKFQRETPSRNTNTKDEAIDEWQF